MAEEENEDKNSSIKNSSSSKSPQESSSSNDSIDSNLAMTASEIKETWKDALPGVAIKQGVTSAGKGVVKASKGFATKVGGAVKAMKKNPNKTYPNCPCDKCEEELKKKLEGQSSSKK